MYKQPQQHQQGNRTQQHYTKQLQNPSSSRAQNISAETIVQQNYTRSCSHTSAPRLQATASTCNNNRERKICQVRLGILKLVFTGEESYQSSSRDYISNNRLQKKPKS
ncbi:hypothetical protein SOVF_184610 [Spinacia oleracea]|nr:hypothetical protein SOVF_184610 [Spinacia oleracea]